MLRLNLRVSHVEANSPCKSRRGNFSTLVVLSQITVLVATMKSVHASRVGSKLLASRVKIIYSSRSGAKFYVSRAYYKISTQKGPRTRHPHISCATNKTTTIKQVGAITHTCSVEENLH